MTSIGPDLPAHLLAKRKRDAEADAVENTLSRSAQPQASQSPDGSDKRRRIAGPSLPLSVSEIAATSISRNGACETTPPAPARKVLGPSMPPAPLSERPPSRPSVLSADNNDASDSDDDYGPSLPSPSTSSHQYPTPSPLKTPQIPDSHSTSSDIISQEAKPARSSWMTAPPTASELRLNNTDPSRHRARGFNTSNRPHSSAANGANGPASSWTETPEEKRARLQRAVLGIADDPNSAPSPAPNGAATGSGAKSTRADSKKDDETRKRIAEYNTKYRSASLLEQHQIAKPSNSTTGEKGSKGKGAAEGEDDPSKRGFDWEKDMDSSTKMSAASKREMMSRAAGFGGRFSGGGYL